MAIVDESSPRPRARDALGRLMPLKWGYIDKTGREVIPLQFDVAWNFSEGLARVRDAAGDAYIDARGSKALTVRHLVLGGALRKVTGLSDFSEGLACVHTDAPQPSGHRAAFIDKKGNLAIPGWFPNAQGFSEGLAAVSDGKKWGYMDKTGRVVIRYKFDAVGHFQEGLAFAAIDDGASAKRALGYIDRTGAWVVDPQRHEGLPGPINVDLGFVGGLARVHIGGQRAGPHRPALLDRRGMVLRQPPGGTRSPRVQ